MTFRGYLRLLSNTASLLAVVGCSRPSSEAPPPATPAVAATKPAEHGHRPGAHGGIIVEIGRDNYHAEAVFEKGGLLRLYTLGKDEARVMEVETQTLTAYVKPAGGTDAEKLELTPEPQTGDAAGKTSQFVGRLPRELIGRAVEVTVPSIRIAGERFRFGFKSVETHVEEDMPDKIAGDAERELYLTPGGKYTEADIRANGRLTASEKYKGAMSKHNMKPQPGDRTCPITDTKANPKFRWTVGGKVYEFCCPPCIDEFVKMAKEKPEQIKEPEEYRKK